MWVQKKIDREDHVNYLDIRDVKVRAQVVSHQCGWILYMLAVVKYTNNDHIVSI